MRKSRFVLTVVCCLWAALGSAQPYDQPKYLAITDWCQGSGCPLDPNYFPTVSGGVTLTVQASYEYTSPTAWVHHSGSSTINYTYTFPSHQKGKVKFYAKNASIPPSSPIQNVIYPYNDYVPEVVIEATCHGGGDE